MKQNGNEKNRRSAETRVSQWIKTLLQVAMVLYRLPIGGANREILEFILACSTSCLVAAHRTDSDRGPLASVKYAVNLKINGGGETERGEKSSKKFQIDVCQIQFKSQNVSHTLVVHYGAKE